MLHFYRLLLVIILFPCTVFAQNNFKPGYVVTAKGDTISGLIDLTHGDNSKEIRFKNTTADKQQVFTTADIKYYSVDNVASYLKYSGRISVGKVDISKISQRRDTSTMKVDVFIKVEQTGENVNLYSYTDNIKTRYFIKETNDVQPIELEYRVYLIDNGLSKLKDEEYYKIQLINLAKKYAADNEGLVNSIKQIQYKPGDLKSICKRINKDNVIADNSKSKYFRLFAGIAINSTKVDESTSLDNIPSKTFLFPKVSLGIDFYPNPVVPKFIIRAELSATKNKYNNVKDLYQDSRPLSKTTYGFNQFNLIFSTQFLYNFYYTDDFKIYGGAGAAVTFSSYSDNVYYNLYNGQISSFMLSKVWVSIPLKIGAIINNKFDLSLGYTPPANINVSQSSMQAGIGYFF